ncbi:hypothetical protein [Paraburkholderia tropica]|uniref:hypothetical protein n=1 Tax=Paraburkholderia tropica TaxID=92647 RepID=UPI002AB62FC2|nr:hypothetical protein [Paraburkholderia tropica]
MSLKSILQSIFHWGRSEAQSVESTVERVASSVEAIVPVIEQSPLATVISTIEGKMPEALNQQATQASSNIDAAIKIALALKAVDAQQTDVAIQAATNAALAVLYPQQAVEQATA